MSTEYLKKILAGDVPTVDDWNQHLIAFHERYGGATCSALTRMYTPSGESSYQLVARRTKELVPDAKAILDLGCGDGLLLHKLSRLYGPGVELVGVDLSEAEIKRASALVEHATFLCGDARTLDLGESRFDAVVSHMVLMIAAQPNRILQTLRRALRDGGAYVALVQDLPLHSSTDVISQAATAVLRAEFEAYAPVIPERANLEDDAELRALFGAAGFSNVSVEPLEIAGRFDRGDVWNFVQRLYSYGLLATPLLERVRGAIEAAVASGTDADGRFEITMPLKLIVAR